MSDRNRPKSTSRPISYLKGKVNNLFHRGEASFDSSSPEESRKSKNSLKDRQYTPDSSQPTGQNSDDKYYHIGQAGIQNFDKKPEASPQSVPRPILAKQDEKNLLKKLTSHEEKSQDPINRHPSCKFYSEKRWLEPKYNKTSGRIMKPDELENYMEMPSSPIDKNLLDRIQGSIIGMALGDALGAHVEFRPRQYLVANPVKNLVGGGTWGLTKGQFTDDTSMALCLANSLLARKDFCPYDQLVRYKWWYRLGYMSSTGECFDIGNATRQSIDEFRKRQKRLMKEQNISSEDVDYLNDPRILEKFPVDCSEAGVAGNGALMRLTPVPLFFFRHPPTAVEYSGISGQITHGDIKAYDACRYYGALIVAAMEGYSKDQLLDRKFYSKHKDWFGKRKLCPEIQRIAEGSYQNEDGYNGGIRGKGYIVNALEAALWAFWSDGDSFEQGALNAVNLGDDTDTTAAIYGQLAGAYYGYKELPKKWLKHVYAHEFMMNLSAWIVYEGENWESSRSTPSSSGIVSSNAGTNESHKSIVTDPSSNDYFNSSSQSKRSDKDVNKYRNTEHQEASTVHTEAGTMERNKDKQTQPNYSDRYKTSDPHESDVDSKSPVTLSPQRDGSTGDYRFIVNDRRKK